MILNLKHILLKIVCIRTNLLDFFRFAFDDSEKRLLDAQNNVPSLMEVYKVPEGDVDFLTKIFAQHLSSSSQAKREVIKSSFPKFADGHKVMEALRDKYNSSLKKCSSCNYDLYRKRARSFARFIFMLFGFSENNGIPDLGRLLSYFAPLMPPANSHHDLKVNSFSWNITPRQDKQEWDKITKFLCNSTLAPQGFMNINVYVPMANFKIIYFSEETIHEFFSEISSKIGIVGKANKPTISLYDIPFLVEPMDRVSVLQEGIANSFIYSACKTFEQPSVTHISGCYKKWELFVLGKGPYPCDNGKFKAIGQCCAWRDILSKNLPAIMLVMKEAMHRY